MDKADKTRFAELITGLAQTFQTPISAADLENYWQLLKLFPLQAIEQAVVNYCRSPEGHRFLPKPSELVALMQGNGEERALLAWSKLMRAIHQVGAYRSVVFDDPIIHIVISDMGGWQALCAMKIQDEPFRAKEFEKRYSHYLKCPPSAYPKQLVGITDSVNAMNGFAQIKPPTLIGDEQKALQIFQQGQSDCRLLSIKQLASEQFTRLITQKSEEEL